MPSGYLRDDGPGRGATFDDDREVWSQLNMPPNATGNGITLNQFLIRIEEHQRTTEAITRQAAQSAGYSGAEFRVGWQRATDYRHGIRLPGRALDCHPEAEGGALEAPF